MKNNNTQTLKGFRDFLPNEKKTRDYVQKKIIEVFETFGFEPIETPTLEYSSLLLGKYGNEADKLVYSFQDKGKRNVSLRYDQTVPTSRVLSQYQNDLPKYFRRYQIQNVFRADKPQKGRYREFTQCDCDIFGTQSSVADAELIAVYYAVYQTLGINSIQISINDRETLMKTLSKFTTKQTDIFSIIQTIDKLDKLSQQDVKTELVKKGLTQQNATDILESVASAKMSKNLEEIIESSIALGVDKNAIKFNPSLARGLDYYTGMIFEGNIPQYTVGSVGGGGRYDKLIEELCDTKISASGFGIGFDRTVEAVKELNLLPKDIINTTQVLVTLFNKETIKNALEIASKLRMQNIKTEVYPETDKLGKQFKLANQKNIPYVVVIGESEIEQDKVQLKNMETGEQNLLSIKEAIEKIKSD